MTALIIAFAAAKDVNISLLNIIYAMLVGFTAYGLSIFFYVKAQRYLGAARTSAYYAAALARFISIGSVNDVSESGVMILFRPAQLRNAIGMVILIFGEPFYSFFTARLSNGTGEEYAIVFRNNLEKNRAFMHFDVVIAP